MKKTLAMAGVCLLAGAASAGLTVKDGDKVAFMGDSITQFGNDPGGYVRLVLKAFGATAEDIVRIEEAWRTMPGTSQVSAMLSRADYERYLQEAKTRGVKVSDVIAERLSAK